MKTLKYRLVVLAALCLANCKPALQALEASDASEETSSTWADASTESSDDASFALANDAAPCPKPAADPATAVY